MRRLVVLLALLAAACSDGKPAAAPETTGVTQTSITTTTAAAPTTAKPTTTSTTLKPTTTSSTLLGMGPGDATIAGTVTGPTGPVDGAIVRVERLVGKNVATQDVTTSGGGSWTLASILGGSYRVRAFRPPDYGTSPTESFFLAANERKIVDLKMPAAGVERITATVSPSPPRVDQTAILTIQIGIGRVDDQGRPSITPRPGVPLILTPAAGLALEGTPEATTDANGSAAWRIRCLAEGANTFQLTVATGITQVRIPACAPGAPPPAPTTTRAR